MRCAMVARVVARPRWVMATQLGRRVSTLAKRKRLAEVLTVFKHALFKAMMIADGADDPDDINRVTRVCVG